MQTKLFIRQINVISSNSVCLNFTNKCLKDYLRINKAVVSFFHENGIVEVTIQPEFFKDNDNIQLMPEYGMGQCLMQCNTNECLDRNCCEPTDIEVIEHSKVSSQVGIIHKHLISKFLKTFKYIMFIFIIF